MMGLRFAEEFSVKSYCVTEGVSDDRVMDVVADGGFCDIHVLDLEALVLILCENEM
jgi:hypothetical protein